MDFQAWDFSTSSTMLDPTLQAAFPFNMTSYFRRPSRVTKQSSRNNSPRTANRRRMTTTGYVPARTRSVVDRQRTSMPHLSDTQYPASRPISWHPNMMMDEMSHLQVPDSGINKSLTTTPYMTAEINGLVTPMSYPVMDEPQIQELITPLEGLSANEAGSGYDYSQDFGMAPYWLPSSAKESALDFDPAMYPMPMMNYQQGWCTDSHYTMPNVPTAPTSPSFLPVAETDLAHRLMEHANNEDEGEDDEEEEEEEESDSEELVGMGLYDSPADVQSSSLLFGSFDGPSGRKCLKLEDSFEPSSSQDGDDDDDDDNDDDDDDEDDDADADAVAEDDDNNRLAASPVNTTQMALQHQEQQQHQQHQPPHSNSIDALAAAQYADMVNTSYMVHQPWQLSSQNAYGWI